MVPTMMRFMPARVILLLYVVALTATFTTTGAVDASNSKNNNNDDDAVADAGVGTSAHRRARVVEGDAQEGRVGTAGVTSHFTRPPAHPALDFDDERLATPGAKRRRSGGLLRGERNVNVNDNDNDNDAPVPEQVHLIPRGPGQMTVVWASSVAVEPGAVVRFGRVKETSEAAAAGVNDDDDDALHLTLEATISSTAYTAQICLGEPNNVEAVMGNPHPVSMANLTYLANTSRWAPEDANNYRVIHGPDDVVPKNWFRDPPWGKAICLAYNNPDAQYQSPIINKAHMGRGGGDGGGGGGGGGSRGGLVAGETYRYRLPGDAKGTRRTFRAPPSPASESSPSSFSSSSSSSSSAAPAVIFGVVGDTGQTEVTHAVFQHLQSMTDLDVLLHTGDLSYADGFPPRWDSFGRLAEPLMSRVPLLAVPGNHDVTTNGLELMAYHTRYPTPHASSGSASPDWWSLDIGPVHVVGLSSYAPVATDGPGMFDGADSPQRAWLMRDLAAVNRHNTPWIVVMFHAPWYNSNAGHYKEGWRAQEALEDVLYDAGVDVVLNGHVHAYERSHPVRRWKRDACGAVHIVVGDGGNYEGPYGNRWRRPQPEWSAFREGSFGAGRLEIHNDTHASWQWRRTTCVEPAGETGLNETWYAPTGDRGVNCSTVPDVSDQAMEQVDFAVITRDVVACPNRAVGSGPGTVYPSPSPPPPSAADGGDGDGGMPGSALSSAAAAVIAFLTLGWAGTLFGLIRVYVLLRRERGVDGVGFGVMLSSAGRRRHVMLHDDIDNVEL